jgi:cytidylate kinase
LAEELKIPFVDRLISVEDAAAGRPSGEGLTEEERASSPVSRFLSYFARTGSDTVIGPDPIIEDDQSIRERTESALRAVAGGAPAVVLGRAGAIVLGARPRAFHVRLDGPVDRRLKWAAQFERFDEETLRRRQNEADRVRSSFVKRLYHVDPSSASLYHLVLDPTVLGVDRAVHVLLTAVTDYFEANP